MRLIQLYEVNEIAIMCAEKHYWRCHRRIISDYLMAEGIQVLHIIDKGRAMRHRLISFAVVRDGAIVYPTKVEQGSLVRASS